MKKMIQCKTCGNQIASNAKVCPNCGGKNKKPFYKKVWFWLFLGIIIIIILTNLPNSQDNDVLDDNDVNIVSSQFVEGNDKYNYSGGSEETIEEEKTDSKIEEENKVVEQENTSSKTDEIGLSKEFKAAMDSYEKFMDEYVAFMKKYSNNPSDLSLLADYAYYISKYADFVEDFEKWEDEEMNTVETAYYIDVQSRVNKKLLEVAQ